MPHILSYRCIRSLILLLLYWQISGAQDISDDKKSICAIHHESIQRCMQLVREFTADKDLLQTNESANLDNPFGDTKAVVSKASLRALIIELESAVKAKADQAALQVISVNAATTQIGGAPSASGSTNLVSKPTTTDFISLAAESGAFTDTLNGTTMTIQANALGLTKYFANRPVFDRWRSGYADAIQPLTFTVTLNVAQNNSSSVVPAGSANSATSTSIASVLLPANNASFSSFGTNYSIYRRYNPQDKKFLEDWTNAIAANQNALDLVGKSIAAVIQKLFTPDISEDINKKIRPDLLSWHKAGADAEKTRNFDKFVIAYSIYEDAFCDAVLSSSKDAPKNILTLSQALDAFNQAVYKILYQARGKPLATLSYLYSTPQGKPATHSATVVLSYLFRGDSETRRTPLSGAQLTANFTTSVYATLPAGADYGRLRDFQMSGEFDKPFGGTLAEPRGTWSLAAYGQYQYDPTVLNITQGNLAPGTNISLPGDAQVLLGTAGWLGVAQGKVVINLRKGLSVPVALKWSNKTDLLKGNDVRGQVGLSYDLSALSKLITGNN
jgi:hypothetical protein